MNLDSVFGLVQAAVAVMLGQASVGGVRGHIVLVASTAAQRGEAFHADYAASKGALLSLTKSLSSELAGQGILCNCVAPGWVRTEMSAGTLTTRRVQESIGNDPLGERRSRRRLPGRLCFCARRGLGSVRARSST